MDKNEKKKRIRRLNKCNNQKSFFKENFRKP